MLLIGLVWACWTSTSMRLSIGNATALDQRTATRNAVGSVALSWPLAPALGLSGSWPAPRISSNQARDSLQLGGTHLSSNRNHMSV